MGYGPAASVTGKVIRLPASLTSREVANVIMVALTEEMFGGNTVVM